MKPISSFLQTLNSSFPWHSTDNPAPFLLTLLAGFLLILSVGFRRRRRLRLPPGPPGVPLLGNLPFLDPELHTYFTELAQKYGPIVKLQLGQKIGIIINSPSVAREVLKDQDITFANRDVPQAGRAATYGGYNIVWSQYGPEWRMMRKTCTVKMLSSAQLDSVYELRRREVRNTVAHLYERAGSAVNVGEQVFVTIYNIVTSTLWGGGLVGGDERDRIAAEFRELVSEITELLGKPNVSDFFPCLARFDLQGIEKRMLELVVKLDNIFEKMIDERLRSTDEKRNDFLQFLLDVNDDGDSKTPLTMVQLKAVLMDMVIGGTDTSSNTIEFLMAEMIKNPKIANKVQQELSAVVGEHNLVEESHIHTQLPYLKAVVKETLRLHPVLPLLVPHSPTQTTTLSNYDIPNASRVFINVWAIHRDPNLWQNPSAFHPDRFMNNAKFDFNGSDFGFIPFGSGRRNCPGIGMAERMIMYLVATLMHSFDWRSLVELEDGEKLEIVDKFGIVLKMKTPLVAVLTPRLPHPSLYRGN